MQRTESMTSTLTSPALPHDLVLARPHALGKSPARPPIQATITGPLSTSKSQLRLHPSCRHERAPAQKGRQSPRRVLGRAVAARTHPMLWTWTTMLRTQLSSLRRRRGSLLVVPLEAPVARKSATSRIAISRVDRSSRRRPQQTYQHRARPSPKQRQRTPLPPRKAPASADREQCQMTRRRTRMTAAGLGQAHRATQRALVVAKQTQT